MPYFFIINLLLKGSVIRFINLENFLNKWGLGFNITILSHSPTFKGVCYAIMLPNLVFLSRKSKFSRLFGSISWHLRCQNSHYLQAFLYGALFYLKIHFQFHVNLHYSRYLDNFIQGSTGGVTFWERSQFFGGAKKIGKIPNCGAAGAKIFEKFSIF